MSFLERVQATRMRVLFSCDNGFQGALSVYGQMDAALTLTLVIQRAGRVRSWDLDGNSDLIGVAFEDADSFIVLARRSGAIIASGVFEVDCALSALGQLLIPRSLNNLLLTQELQQPPRTSPLQVEQVVTQ